MGTLRKARQMKSDCLECPNAVEGATCYDVATCSPRRRRHKLSPGKCAICDRETNDFHPSHDPSSRCESGKRNHCTCDVCF